MAEHSNAVFISYRRDVAGYLALALYQHLADHGLDAFYDIESIRTGQFGTIILNQIAARPYFTVVLTPGTLERCVDPEDWLRREIEQALATDRRIVPVHTPNFDFGDLEQFLPDDLGEEVQRFNALELPQKWFKYAAQQLVEEFLVPTEIEAVVPPAHEQAVVHRLQQAARAVPAVTEVQLSAQEYFQRALARADDDLEAKIADYDEAIRLNPEYAWALINRGNSRRGLGDLEGAIADYDEAIDLNPREAVAFNDRGGTRSDMGDLEGAIADLDEAIRLNPEYALAFYNRGLTRRDTGDPEGAIADLDEAIRLDPRDADAFYARGLSRRDMEDTEGAIADYDEAIRLNPEYADAFMSRGNARSDMGDLEGAIADLDEAVRLNPEYALAFYNRGLTRREMGNLEGAIADVEQGARLAPEDKGFPRLLEELRGMGAEGG